MTPAEIGCIVLGLIACGHAIWAGWREVYWRDRQRTLCDQTIALQRYYVQRNKQLLSQINTNGRYCAKHLEINTALRDAIHHLKQHKKEHTAEANRILAELDQ